MGFYYSQIHYVVKHTLLLIVLSKTLNLFDNSNFKAKREVADWVDETALLADFIYLYRYSNEFVWTHILGTVP